MSFDIDKIDCTEYGAQEHRNPLQKKVEIISAENARLRKGIANCSKTVDEYMTANERLRQRVKELEAVLLDYEEGVKSKEWASIVKDAERVKDLEVYKAAIEDIVSDPITCEALQMKRGVAEILAIARKAINAAMEKGGPL